MDIKRKNKESDEKIRVQSTQQQLNIKEIRNGIIITKDHRFIRILEIKPSQFLLKSVERQNAIARSFYGLLRVLPKNTQFMSVVLPSNLKEHIEILDHDMAKETNRKCLRLDNEFRGKLIEKGNSALSRRYFLSYEYESQEKTFKGNDFEKIYNYMKNIESAIKSALEYCGNSIIVKEPSDKRLKGASFYEEAEIIYSLLNRKKARTTSFDSHFMNIYLKYKKVIPDSNFIIPPCEYLAPDTISFSNSHFVVIDDTYYSYLYVPSNGYPSFTVPGWLNLFINSYDGIDTSVYLSRQEASIKRKIAKNIVYSRSNTNDISDTSESFDASMKSLDGATYLKSGMNAGQDFYYVSTLITVSGSSPEDVNAKISALKTTVKQYDITLKELSFEGELAFKSYLPLCHLEEPLYKKMKRNVLSEGAMSFYPFICNETNDTNGIYFGDDMTSGALAIIDNFNSSIYPNANIFLCGKSGAGKTFALSLMALRMRTKHIPVVILAPEKQHEFLRLCDAVGGQYIQIGPGSSYRLNIMEIKVPDEDASLLNPEAQNSSWLEAKISSLSTFFRLLVKDISIEEISFLERAILKAYLKKGITEDNESVFDEKDITHRTLKEMPVISDVRDELAEDSRCFRLASAISRLCIGPGSCFNGLSNINMDNEFIVIGLETLESDLLPLGIYMAMEYVWQKAKENRLSKKALIIDEWWKLAGNPVAAEYSYKMVKLVRAYGMSMILATQQISDINASGKDSIGKAIIGNCSIKILMSMENNDIKAVDEILDLNNSQIDIISNLKRGEALFTAGSDDLYIRFAAGELERKLITTDREENSKMLMEEKERRKREIRDLSSVLESVE